MKNENNPFPSKDITPGFAMIRKLLENTYMMLQRTPYHPNTRNFRMLFISFKCPYGFLFTPNNRNA